MKLKLDATSSIVLQIAENQGSTLKTVNLTIVQHVSKAGQFLLQTHPRDNNVQANYICTERFEYCIYGYPLPLLILQRYSKALPL